MKPTTLLLAAATALLGTALLGCEPNSAPQNGLMTTDADHGLEVHSDSPSAPRERDIRAGATIPPATRQPETPANPYVAPMPPGQRTTPTERPYSGNPTTQPSPGVSASPTNPPAPTRTNNNGNYQR